MLQSTSLSRRADIAHAFTTRWGPDGAPLDLGRGAPRERWEPVLEALGLPGAGVAIASQVHGREVLRAEGPGLVGEGDALVTDLPGLVVAVRVADCVPVLVAREGGVAAIHAGWRGVAAGVIPAALARLPGAGSTMAAVGPAISARVYEVGEEVVEGIRRAGVPLPVFLRPGSRGRPHVDVQAAAVWQLREAGVESVEVLERCTWSEPERFWSHRRDSTEGGRQVGLIGLRP